MGGPHVTEIAHLRRKYADVPMSVADACLVRLAEQLGQCAVLTLDDDFTVYRRHGRHVIPLLSPNGDFTSSTRSRLTAVDPPP
jgi:hypothetical protein